MAVTSELAVTMGSVSSESNQVSQRLQKRPIKKGEPRMSASQPEDRPAVAEASKEGTRKGGVLLFLVCFVGIFGSYFVYGLLQEKM